MERVLPIIKEGNQRFEKYQQVHARAANSGEVVVSHTDDGEETTKTASEGEFVVKNLTKAREQYVVGEEKFSARYRYVEDVDGEWKLYDPIGEVLAIEITADVLSDLGVDEEFCIIAPWGSEQVAREGDMFVSPVPQLDEIYRVARNEFDETYRLANHGA